MLNRFDELVFQNGRGAAADVQRGEFITKILGHLHFLTQIDEVFASFVFFEQEAVESAIRAQCMTERDMSVHHVLMTGLRFGMAI